MSNVIPTYTVARQKEFKALTELRARGTKCHVPHRTIERRSAKGKTVAVRVPSAPGYVFGDIVGDRVPLERTGVVLSRLGVSRTSEVRGLYPRRAPPLPAPRPFCIGECVEIKDGPFASFRGTIAAKRGRRQWLIEGKGQRIAVQSQSLIRIDPG
jgi:transcription antitermination factor NusG